MSTFCWLRVLPIAALTVLLGMTDSWQPKDLIFSQVCIHACIWVYMHKCAFV